MQSRLLVTVIALCCVLAGCGDDNTTIYQSTATTGSIFGQVLPVASQITIEAHQGTKLWNATRDSLGYFRIENLAPGIYQVDMKNDKGFSRLFDEVDVEAGHGTSMGRIYLGSQYSWPLYWYSPSDHAVGVNLGARITITADTLLEVASLQSEVHISPALAGSWVEDYYGENATYSFENDSGFRSGTTYTVTIGRGLKSASGQAWNDSLQWSFSTMKFMLSSLSTDYNLSAVPSYLGNYDHTLITFRYNMPIDSSSLTAVTISPSAPISLHFETYNENAFSLVTRGDLVPGQTYRIIAGAALRSKDGGQLEAPDTVEFTVQPLGITAFTATDSYYYTDTIIDPTQVFAGRIRFNAVVDADSFNAAAHFDPALPGFWINTSNDDANSLRFFSTDANDLIDDTVYVLHISGSVALAGSAKFETDRTCHFRTYPARIVSIYPSSGTRNVYSSSEISMLFNVDMDQPSVESSFALLQGDTADVPGLFTWETDYYSGGPRLRFRPNAYLSPGLYTIRLATTARTASGKFLKTPGYSYFTVGF